MSDKQQKYLCPDEIKAIREYLGLSKSEAGRLLGGGDRQFQRYEYPVEHRLHLRPSLALCNLLRLLAARPGALERIIDPEPIDIEDLRHRTVRRRAMVRSSTRIYRGITSAKNPLA